MFTTAINIALPWSLALGKESSQSHLTDYFVVIRHVGEE